MTEQYLPNNINEEMDAATLELVSYDFRQIQSFVPTGTTATIQGMKLPMPSMLKRIAWCGVLGPGVGESVALRLYRIRPVTNPAGFGYIQLNDVFTINAASFPGAGVELDFSDRIRPGLCVLPGEYLACSWVHSGPQQMQPLNMNWSFVPAGVSSETEPPPTTTNDADVLGT